METWHGFKQSMGLKQSIQIVDIFTKRFVVPILGLELKPSLIGILELFISYSFKMGISFHFLFPRFVLVSTFTKPDTFKIQKTD